MSDFHLSVQPTPNPKALKFIVNVPLSEGRYTFESIKDTRGTPLFKSILEIAGVDKIFVQDNYMTITRFGYAAWEIVEEKIALTIKKHLQTHRVFKLINKGRESRENLPKDLQEIEAILDQYIRPGLRGDGGDLTCIEYRDNILTIRYEGACNACPSSTTGTLMAIKSVLQDEYNEEIDVQIR